ncbi:hypothetical protein BAE44_0005046 [Dichanthelium oligosanthes]|uniref:Uncharacterized protein n=1 Tax=Dichanthelium oligosanthes TaxID=888268 RepID=A0A1E5W934_9POAL|nr:hypothetical protein BAE44_0005046 [Dichanthelium oligosanthes]
MAHMLCWPNLFRRPGAAAPPLRADCVVDDGYEELPVSEPPHVQRGLSRGETFAVEQVVAPAPDGGVGGGAWLAQVCASIYGKMAGPFRS